MKREDRKSDDMEHRNGGFTLVEVIVAAMLSSMLLLSAFPVLTTGRNLVTKMQHRWEAVVIGDGVFDQASAELQNTGEVCIETMEDWEERFDSYDVELDVTWEESDWMVLSVSLIRNDTVCYERCEWIPYRNGQLQKEE